MVEVKQLILDNDGMRTGLIHETGIPESSLLLVLKETAARKLVQMDPSRAD